MIDPKLIIGWNSAHSSQIRRPKIKAILATRGVYSTSDLVVQFKTHILCLLEYSNAAIYHASSSHLESLDSLQTCFLRDIGLPVEDAFLNFHMAPLKLRRDIGVL